MNNKNNNWITLREASSRFKVSEGTLRTWLKKGWISGVLQTETNSGCKWQINPTSVLGLVPERDEISLTQAAQILGVGKARVTQLVLSGKLDYRVARLGNRKYLKFGSVWNRKVHQERCLLVVTTENEQKT